MAALAPSSRPLGRPYRDFLTPALHRRFTRSVMLSICLCHIVSVSMGEINILWIWFPLGWAGIRTMLLMISILPIYILRVSQMHIGTRTTTSPFETFRKYLIRYNTIQTLFWYGFSAWWYGEIFIWSAPSSAKMGLVDHGRSYERAKVNERSVYARSLFLLFAVVQSIVHLYQDSDRVKLPCPKLDLKSKESRVVPPRTQILKSAQYLALSSLFQTMTTVVVGTILYFAVFRDSAWSWGYYFAMTVASISVAQGPGRFPNLLETALRLIFYQFGLVIVWKFINVTFDAFVSQEPLKLDKPLTDDSKDPNGSLLIGLKARKEIPRSFAFWELVLISYKFDVRRSTIYQEIDRSNGSTWSQILASCISEITSITNRIDALKPAPPPPPPTEHEIQTLPRLAQPIKEDNVLSDPLANAQLSKLGAFVKSHGNSPHPDGSMLTPHARKFIEYGKNQVVSASTKAKIQEDGLPGFLLGFCAPVVQAPAIGYFFRQNFARRACVVINGSPYSRQSTTVDAIRALTRLAANAVKEDTMGLVYKDVSTIIRTFMSVTKNVELFLAECPVHWTDVDFRESNRRKVDEVEVVLEELRSGLESMLITYGEYLSELKLSPSEIMEAKTMVSKAEMKERGKR